MRFSPRLQAILQALFVTFLWSTSWVLIKRTLAEIPPLTFAGLRYSIAVLILLPGLRRQKTAIRTLSVRDWGFLAGLGLVFYTMTQGGQFLTLNHLEAVTFSLLLNFTTVLVALIGVFTLREVPSRWQWAGIVIFVAGALVYFYPVSVPAGKALGFALAGFTVCANAVAALLGRAVNRKQTIPSTVVTVISMGIGALVILGIGLAVQGLPPLSRNGWIVIGWLAVVNTALAFTLWNSSLRILSATESSIINNTMLVQIAVLAWLFLGERLSMGEVAGLILASSGALLVQVARPEHRQGR
jgi:drug/metabolite transporter (DMT)-like permease